MSSTNEPNLCPGLTLRERVKRGRIFERNYSLVIELCRRVWVDEEVVVEPLVAALAPESEAGQVEHGIRRSLQRRDKERETDMIMMLI